MKLSSIYSQGMVLQRESVNLIRGTFEENEDISVSFDAEALDVEYDSEKMLWSASVPEMPAGGPHSLCISVNGKKNLEISDILFGDVFILGGQSNMELPLIWTTDFHYDEIRSADFAEIRQFEVPKIPLFGKMNDILEGGFWVNADQGHINNFSAIGFYFAKEKYLKDHIPVGLVQTAVGGAPVESLMSEKNLRECFSSIESKYIHSGECNSWMNLWQDDVYETFNMPQTFYKTKYEKFKGSIWLQRTIEVPDDWCDQEVELRLGTLMDGDTTYVNGNYVGGFGFKYPPRRFFLKPGTLHAGNNVITIRLVIDTNIGGAVEKCPYYLKLGEKKIDLCGSWKMRIGAASEDLEGQTFFIWSPTALFNSMIYPIRNYSAKAILFYQGESNCEYPHYYGPLLQEMDSEWRSLFGEKLPFYMAEVTYWLGDVPVYEADPFDGVRESSA